MYETSEYVGRALEQSVEGAFFLSFSRKNCQKAAPQNTTQDFEKNYQSISTATQNAQVWVAKIRFKSNLQRLLH